MFTPKPLDRQVVVLTGATSGIGLATARELSKRGADLVIVARNREALDTLAAELERPDAGCLAVEADVADAAALENVATQAIERYGRIDTWVNNAAAAMFGRLADVSIEDHRRVFDVNYFGVVQGSLIAMRAMRARGGTIINIGSVLSDRALVAEGPYSASKAAVKGFTDALRMEIDADGLPINVTLIKPSAIDTPYMEHAKNLLGSEGTVTPPPHYAPETVAEAIAFACENRRRDLYVGFGGYLIGVLGSRFPRATDLVMSALMVTGQETKDPGRPAMRDNLYQPRQDLAERSSLGLPARRSSLFLKAQMHPLAAAGMIAGAGLALASALLRPRRSRSAFLPRRSGLF
jgi:NAD(P)-dependent dehydrogenase (short-subunit alcohol dehydrogenase family)